MFATNNGTRSVFLSSIKTINPATGQNTLTGVPEFGGRTYQIKLIVDDGSHTNTLPID